MGLLRSVFAKLGFVSAALIMLMQSLVFIPTATAVGTNLINNPSVETAASATVPQSWATDKWGTNKATFAYQNTGHTGSKSLKVDMTSRTSGDAKWYFTNVAVKPSTKYTYSEYYISNVATEIDVEYTNVRNKRSYKSLSVPAASADWKQQQVTFTTPANVKSLTIFHIIDKVGSVQTDDFSLVEGDGSTTPPTPAPTTPTVNFSAPANGSTVKDTISVSATATDVVSVSGVQFKLDGANLGTEDTTAPYTVNWDTKTVANGTHTLTAVARNGANLTATATTTVNVSNVIPTPPTVTITAPSNGATVAGTQTISATATDTIGMAGVQFAIDNVNLGVEDTTAPYSATWDTTTIANGTHTLSATARNTSGINSTVTATVTVNNIVAPPTPPTPPSPPTVINLLSNPSFETASGTMPANWLTSSWGANTASFSYLTAGHTGSRSVKTEITAYTNGAANWYYTPVTVTAGKTYKYENWYQSNVASEIDAEVTMADGTVQYYYLASVPANAAWTKVSAQFIPPAGAKSLVIYQILAAKGWVIADDYSLSEYTPAQFNRALVSLTFDDGWRSIYSNGLPVLNKYGLASTQYLNSEPIMGGYPDYMTYAQVQAFAAGGHELAWHTQTHADLTTLSIAAIDGELTIPATFLSGIAQPASAFKNFATPYGAYNPTAVSEIKKYYRSHRSTDVGYNTKDAFDIYNIKVQNITNTTTPADVQAWVTQAMNDKTWLVLVYHEVDAGAADPTYAVTPANLDSELNIVKQSGITVKTLNAALDEILTQL